MTLYWRVQALWFVTGLTAVTAGTLAFGLVPPEYGDTAALLAAVFAIVVAGAVGVLWQMLVIRGRSRRLMAAFETSDLAVARREIDEIEAAFKKSQRMRQAVAINRTVLLCEEGRFHEALDVARSVDRARLWPKSEPFYLNNLAWCLLHTGHASEARPLADDALARAPSRDCARPACPRSALCARRAATRNVRLLCCRRRWLLTGVGQPPLRDTTIAASRLKPLIAGTKRQTRTAWRAILSG